MKHSPSRNLKSHTPARKSPLCYWDSWIGEGKPWEISVCQKRPRDWVQNPALQYTPWNSTLNSIETAQGQGTQTRSTPEIRQLYPDLDAPKLCWILMPISHLPIPTRQNHRVGKDNSPGGFTKFPAAAKPKLASEREGRLTEVELLFHCIVDCYRGPLRKYGTAVPDFLTSYSILRITAPRSDQAAPEP